MIRVTLYGKPGCCLCDEARAEIAAVQAERPFELHEVDVTLDPALHREYGERIPVVEVDGQEPLEAHVDRAALAKLLDRVAT
ncbi:MAG TPA: glutaredoxin family protein [Thermoleophilaceae bacterium]|jgi:glutaredoxin